MSVESAAVGQLLKRFEGFRSCGLIEVLAVSQAKWAPLIGELPVQYSQFNQSCQAVSTVYGSPVKGCFSGITFRFLGADKDIRRFLIAAQAAGELLGGKLGQSHVVNRKHLPRPSATQHKATWLISMFTAAERHYLPGVQMNGDDWFVWNRATGLAVAKKTVEMCRAPQPAMESFCHVAAVEDSAPSFGILQDAVEASIALMAWLDRPRKKKEPSDKETKKDLTTDAALRTLWETAGGKEKLKQWSQRRITARHVGVAAKVVTSIASNSKSSVSRLFKKHYA